MAIQKKSLISNRTATKKALVAKPEVTKTAPNKVVGLHHKVVGLTHKVVGLTHRVVIK